MKLHWTVELAEFSQNSPAAVIRVIGEAEDGRKASTVLTIMEPTETFGEPIIHTRWLDSLDKKD